MHEDKLTLVNFRDMGGLQTVDGRKIRSGKLYRTSIFAPKTYADKKYIREMGLDAVIDLRNAQEVDECADCLPDGVEYVHAPVFFDEKYIEIIPTKAMRVNMFRGDESVVNHLFELMNESYGYMPYASKAYGEMFKRMNKGETLAFHCTAGKDRTGVLAMLVELALGREVDEARRQYLITDEYRKRFMTKLDRMIDLLPMSRGKKNFAHYSMRVHDELFDRAVEAIFSKYSTIQDFYQDVYGISTSDLENWKQFYLE